ncbi:MAG: L-2-amino-thiazoline-4-carboxylic acid hydrolase [Kofleriaceae bacterium]
MLLYRALVPRLGQPAALALVDEVVRAGGVAFLAASIPPLPPAGLAAAARALVPRFFNADGEVTEPGPERVDFTVTRCRFVELMAAVGTPELAPLCCAVDEAFFASQRGVRLDRPETLAAGDPRCAFHFSVLR